MRKAAVRGALNDAALPIAMRSKPAVRARRQPPRCVASPAELLPHTPSSQRDLAEALIKSTLSAVAKQFSEQPHSEAEIAAYSDALADMLCAYLERLAAKAHPTPKRSRRA
ncbi:MAG: hypothetical protein R3B07_36785 [Polyangiaceae bacterium]